MYATWKTYTKAVAGGSNKMFDWPLPSWSDSTKARGDLVLFSTPGNGSYTLFLRREILSVEDWGTMYFDMGARPALYG